MRFVTLHTITFNTPEGNRFGELEDTFNTIKADEALSFFASKTSEGRSPRMETKIIPSKTAKYFGLC